jgi:hypothetical protein
LGIKKAASSNQQAGISPLLSFYHHFFQQAESLGFFSKPQFDLSPGNFEEFAIAVGFQVAFAIPFLRFA